MSPWTEISRADNATSPDPAATATIMRAAIAFSAHFVRTFPDVSSARYIRLFVDEGAYRVGFKFSQKPEENSLTLTPNGRKKGTMGRVVQTQAVMTRYAWLAAVGNLRESTARRFPITWDSVDGLYFITLRPSFELSARSASEIPANAVGIYRYMRGPTIVYIGKGEIRSRASQDDHRDDWIFDRIEYSVVPDNDACFRTEAYWLEEHRLKHGTLPEYNRVGGRTR